MKKLLIIILGGLFVAGISTTAKAVSILPGQSVGIIDTFILPGDATLVASITNVLFTGEDVSNNIVFSGAFTQNVYKDSLGMLFEYTFSNTGWNGGTEGISEFFVSDFSGFTTDIYASGPGIPPSPPPSGPGPIYPASRSSSGDIITFEFINPPVTPGQMSEDLWVQTNAPAYNSFGAAALQDGGNTTLRTFEPAVPEPATIFLFALSCGSMAFFRRKQLFNI